VSAYQQARQLRELLNLLPLEPTVRAHLDVALRAAEASPIAPGEYTARLVEAVTPLERELLLRQRHPHADAFLTAWRAGVGR
jgi:hypothetical protein